MNTFITYRRNQRPASRVAEESTSFTPDSDSPNGAPRPDPQDPSPSDEDDRDRRPRYILIERKQLQHLERVARECKSQAKLAADSLLMKGPDHVTEANAVYGVERQIANLQREIKDTRQQNPADAS